MLLLPASHFPNHKILHSFVLSLSFFLSLHFEIKSSYFIVAIPVIFFLAAKALLPGEPWFSRQSRSQKRFGKLTGKMACYTCHCWFPGSWRGGFVCFDTIVYFSLFFSFSLSSLPSCLVANHSMVTTCNGGGMEASDNEGSGAVLRRKLWNGVRSVGGGRRSDGGGRMEEDRGKNGVCWQQHLSNTVLTASFSLSMELHT